MRLGFGRWTMTATAENRFVSLDVEYAAVLEKAGNGS